MKATKRKAEVRREQAKECVLRLVKMLREVVREPVKHTSDNKLLIALSSQGRLAAYENAALEVFAMSLNHQKKVAMDLLGGYEVLDKLRLEAATRIQACSAASESKPRRREATKDMLRAEIAALKEQVSVLLEDLYVLQRAFDIRCQQARRYASDAGPKVLALCGKEQREVEASLVLVTNASRHNVRRIDEGSRK